MPSVFAMNRNRIPWPAKGRVLVIAHHEIASAHHINGGEGLLQSRISDRPRGNDQNEHTDGYCRVNDPSAELMISVGNQQEHEKYWWKQPQDTPCERGECKQGPQGDQMQRLAKIKVLLHGKAPAA